MGVYQFGTAITITETFRLPPFPPGTPANPTTVVYTIRDPEGGVVTYTFGPDPEVTNPSPGVYVLDLSPPTIPGTYQYEITGTGAVEAVGTGEFTVLQSTIAPQAVPFPQPGPCTPWIDCSDIQARCPSETDLALLDGIATMASQIMFEISGRQFTGQCPRTVRPCNDVQNSCWFAAPWNGWVGWPWVWWYDGYSWGWYDQAGCHCGCESLPRVLLPGYPVTQITEVKIDGVVIAPETYRLDEWRYLTRMRDPANPSIPQRWPSCQYMNLDDDQPGTWSVTYVSGIDPPLIGKAAAAALACELVPGADCKLPTGARRIVRQGITIDKIQPLAQMLLEGSTGIVEIDAFMAAYNPGKLRRRPSIWSPDGPRFARPVGGQ